MTAMEPDSQTTSSPSSATQDAGRTLAAVREREWPGVRITDVEMVPHAPGTPDRHLCLRAHIRLGRLTPADVMVHVSTATRTVDIVPDDAWARRLTCAQNYGNGHFVFEGYVPEYMLEPKAPGLTVVIEARSQGNDTGTPLEPVKRRMV